MEIREAIKEFDEAAINAAAALSLLVQKGDVTHVVAVAAAKRYDAAVAGLRTQHAAMPVSP